MSAIHYDPSDYVIDADPYPLYRRMRDEAPLYHNEKMNFWVLSRFADVWDATMDFETYSSAQGTTLEDQPQGFPLMLWMDPPGHQRLRNLVSKAFTPRRIQELHGIIRELAAEFLTPFVGTEGMDAINDFTGKLPMNVISTLLGIPREDREMVRLISNRIMHREEGSVEHTADSMEAAMELLGYFGKCVEERKKHPTEDMMTALVQAEVPDPAGGSSTLSEEEILGFCILLAVAGNETVTKLLGNGIYWLWKHADQRAELAQNASLLPGAVEELLRYDPPSHYQGRVTMKDVQWYGQTVPQGARVLLLTGSTGRDEREFPDRPEQFDIHRHVERHLGFGHSRHICLGATLARLESKIAIEELLRRFPRYEIDIDHAERVHSSNVRGYAKLPLRF
ncbi:MAG TPA: cytochrome P450 [Polyangiaceae bacterium]|nr:cytochrome P450 [Polyangiaceae bacterium]